MKKLTLGELRDLGLERKWESAVIVFKKESFPQPYSETERSYKVHSSDKYFTKGMIGNSIYGDCLDGKDLDVRLDSCMYAERGAWQVDYCYIVK